MVGLEGNTPSTHVRNTCAAVARKAVAVKINEDAIKTFVSSLNAVEYTELSKSGLRPMPLVFDNLSEEINFFALLDFLNLGSGYRHELHRETGRGAYETVLFGMMSMHLGGHKLNNQFLNSLAVTDISSHFNFKIDFDRPVQTGITIAEATTLRTLANHFLAVIQDIVESLNSRGFPDLGTFILSVTKPVSGSKQASCQYLVHAVAEMFASMNDSHGYMGQTINFLKKAQQLAANIYLRFRERDERFDFYDIKALTVFPDNVIPAVLRKLGILELSADLQSRIDSSSAVEGEEEIEIRACTVHACELAIQVSHGTLVPFELDYYLWALGKKEGYREVERHIHRNTIYY